MIRLGTRGRGRGAFPAAWMWVMVMLMLAAAATAAAATAAAASVTLYPDAPQCTKAATTLNCDANDASKVYSLESFNWVTNNINKVIIDNTNSTLDIEDPACPDTKREVVVRGSTRVTTVQGTESCSHQLILENSRNIKIVNGVDLVRMVNSTGDEVNLPRVSQFDMQHSTLGEVSVEVDKEKSTIVHSTIGEVKKLVIKGSFVFEVTDSTLGAVEGFVYENPNAAVFTKVTMKSVAEGGFLLHEGTVTIKDSVIHCIGRHGLSVGKGAKLVIENTEIGTVAHDLIGVDDGGSVTFKNVTVGEAGSVSFVLTDANLSVYLLVLLGKYTRHDTQSHLFWVWLYIVVILSVMSILLGAAVIYILRAVKTGQTQGRGGHGQTHPPRTAE